MIICETLMLLGSQYPTVLGDYFMPPLLSWNICPFLPILTLSWWLCLLLAWENWSKQKRNPQGLTPHLPPARPCPRPPQLYNHISPSLAYSGASPLSIICIAISLSCYLVITEIVCKLLFFHSWSYLFLQLSPRFSLPLYKRISQKGFIYPWLQFLSFYSFLKPL